MSGRTRGSCFFILFLYLILCAGSGQALAATDAQSSCVPPVCPQDKIKVMINFEEIDFPDQEPFVDPFLQRVFVPLRFVAEAMGAEVCWEQEKQTVSISRNDSTIEIMVAVTEEGLYIKEPVPRILNGRTVVPIRLISEVLGYQVSWNGISRTVSVVELIEGVEGNTSGINLGDPLGQVLKILGPPDRRDASNYGFEWYIYNRSYSNYIQVGIENDRVWGMYTNAPGWRNNEGIYMGMPKHEVNTLLGRPLGFIEKNGVWYSIESIGIKDVYSREDHYLTLFYDAYDNYRVNGILLLDRRAEDKLDGYYGNSSSRLQDSYREQIFDLANTERARRGMPILAWDDGAALAALEHCRDMIERQFFDHMNPDGKLPYCRFIDAGIEFDVVGENIAVGSSNALNVHHRWMNSWPHRVNILGDLERLGVGVEFGGIYHTYYAQSFYSPR